ncbi:hypothetical protein [Streptomyces doebereineriae]|uniref:Thioesterase family protein n=1 Tax=Streptomyces doebereineriae TaxID=3075528 RepID=A0ABU2VB19_9ACTN|nr:hypothetical protein [Streptomyces sp. DSM 41640]MDT0482750.1 hypothetical protein [Streptomyces sp. DSM 41640]
MTAISTFSIASAFNGPPASANGGYACGRLAELATAGGQLTASVAVSLHLPVPMDTPLTYRPAGKRGHAWHGEDVIASVTGGNGPPPVLELVSAAEAKAAQGSFTSVGHPFPTCFVCGPERAEGGLALRPGGVEGKPGTVACLWTPTPELADERGVVLPEIVWSALDCPGGWTTDPVQRPQLLGRMSAQITELPLSGVEYVVVGRLEHREERTTTNLTALYDAAGGRLLAHASAQWIAIDTNV